MTTKSSITAHKPQPFSLEGYGDNVFRGAVAAPYLEKQGLPGDTLANGDWTHNGNADKVAAAVLDWAVERGASAYCHWFQPMGSTLRHGQTAQVQVQMIDFDSEGRPVWSFSGEQLLRGETDGSSYPNGGLRETHRAGAYLFLDTSSPIFLRGDVIFLPSCMVSFDGHALDEKIPLLRATHTLSTQGVRLLSLLGVHTKSVKAKVGLEQELFLIPREQFNRRPDLQMCGRTLLGRLPPRRQELGDHYMAPPSFASPALACMQEIQRECYKVGIPLRTRHREVAPNQYEFAPTFGDVTTQVDQNLTIMQIIDEVATKHGLAALFQEKPFQGVNGSGKHNNWSLALDNNVNLLHAHNITQHTGNPLIFVVMLSCIVKAVSDHGDLMRLAVAAPGNDFRLGACEAPPATITLSLGESLSRYLQTEVIDHADPFSTEIRPYVPASKTLDDLAIFGGACKVSLPTEDRNRTSSFPYGGHRFEFRAVGSSQNASFVNTVLCVAVGEEFRRFSEYLEKRDEWHAQFYREQDKGEFDAETVEKRVLFRAARAFAREQLRSGWHSVFNGDGYSEENKAMLSERGVWRIDSGTEAIRRFSAEKNVSLFTRHNVLSEEECTARESVLRMHYCQIVEIEVLSIIDMVQQHVLPSVRAAITSQSGYITSSAALSESVTPSASLTNLNELLVQLEKDVYTLKDALSVLHNTFEEVTRAETARTLRLDLMQRVRERADAAEELVAPSLWTLATYKELLFLDQHV